MKKIKLLRITTVPISLKILLHGQLTFFSSNGFEVLAVSADGPEVSALGVEGIPHHVVEMTRKITPARDLISLINLIRVILKFKPDIVHTHTPKAGLLGMIAAWICHVPVRMHTVAGLPLMEKIGLVKQILILTEQITYAAATRVYPNSEGLKKYIETYSSVNLSIIGKGSSNGINTAYFDTTSELVDQAKQLRSKYGISSTDVVFSFVGRLVKDKGIEELVEAFKGLSLPSASQKKILLLVGSFEQLLNPLSNEVYAYLHNSSDVILTGFQNDIRPYLLASDVFVFPSYREGFPNVVMQASCLKIPSIVSDINGCNEIIQTGNTGLIVNPKDSTSLLNAMSVLAADKEKQRIFGEAARRYVVENFDQQYIWHQLKQEYYKLIGFAS